MNKYVKDLKSIVGESGVLVNEPMCNHTTFKIGGPADLLIMPRSIEEVRQVISLLKQHRLPIMVMGNGSNMLVSDLGIRGAVVKIADAFKKITRVENALHVEAGALLSTLANRALAEGLGGFEFASGIPGTVGGAIYMNAGAYGGEMKDVVTKAIVLNEAGKVIELDKNELEFGYRTSSVSKNAYVVLEVVIELEPKAYDDIKMIMDDLNFKRTSKQPLNWPSAGSTFKRPQGYFAGKLIEDAGLRGLRFGDAQVSELHCGFVINRGQATAEQVLRLISSIQKIVYDDFGVALHPEVRLVGQGFNDNAE